MPRTIRETATEAPSCWAIEYWLRHCEGYRVSDASGPIGYVETVLTSSEGEPHSLIVRVGSSFTVLVTVPVEAVEGLDPERERVFIASTVPAGEHVDQQLKLPAAA